MLRITKVHPAGDYRLELRFNNGREGVVDLSDVPHTGVFKAWDDPDFFRKAYVHPEFGTVTWPGDIDLDPYVLYADITHTSIEHVLQAV